MKQAKKSEKIPLSVVKKFPYKTLNRMIDKARAYLKKDEVWQKICKEYDVDADIIDLFPIMFGDLDVIAKTNKGIIILNYRLLTDGDFFEDYSYFVHEGRHALDQMFGDKATKSSDDGDYLHNPYEQQAFSDQAEYIAEQFGDQKAEKYVDDLLEHHDVKDKDEKDELQAILLEKV